MASFDHRHCHSVQTAGLRAVPRNETGKPEQKLAAPLRPASESQIGEPQSPSECVRWPSLFGAKLGRGRSCLGSSVVAVMGGFWTSAEAKSSKMEQGTAR